MMTMIITILMIAMVTTVALIIDDKDNDSYKNIKVDEYCNDNE